VLEKGWYLGWDGDVIGDGNGDGNGWCRRRGNCCPKKNLVECDTRHYKQLQCFWVINN